MSAYERNLANRAPLRLFLALPVHEVVRDALKGAQSELRARLPKDAVRWTPPEQIHLTLLFLGDTPVDRVGELVRRLAPVCARSKTFALCAEGIGFFPLRGNPRVIWAGIADPANRLPEIQGAIARAAAGFGKHQDEHNFSAHLTLGRVQKLPRDQAHLPATLARELADRNFGRWPVMRVDLMRSELSTDGAHHRTVAGFYLDWHPT